MSDPAGGSSVHLYNLSVSAHVASIVERLQKAQRFVFKEEAISLLERVVEKVFKNPHLPPWLTGNGFRESREAA